MTLAQWDTLLLAAERGKLTPQRRKDVDACLADLRLERQHQPAGLTPDEVDAVIAVWAETPMPGQTDDCIAAFQKINRCWLTGTMAAGIDDATMVKVMNRDPNSPFAGLIDMEGA
jgi:hypothetical protein